MSGRYEVSEAFLRRALETIPLGSQTFSKSTTQLPLGASPYYLERGKGSRVWDVDGNEYVDFISGLLAISLGYCDPDVDREVAAQIRRGVTFSLCHELEMEVAERVVEMVPCAERVRFAKNGSDATAAAIRLARAHTGRDHVAFCGYHGWQDWYIGATTKNLGVPSVVQELTHPFRYNDLESLEAICDQYPEQLAAVILEPMNSTWPDDGFLAGVQELAHRRGALLVFDEIITGFRFSLGGAQELFGVTPDLATFGKGIANGFPLSCIAGRSEIMDLLVDVFFSGTYGGETLSLCAARAVLDKIRREPVLETLSRQGTAVLEGTRELLERHDATDLIHVDGHPSWPFLLFQDLEPYTSWQIKTLFLQEVFARGVLVLGTHNMSYAHDEEAVQKLLSVYGEVIPFMRDAVRGGGLEKELRCEALQPLFEIR